METAKISWRVKHKNRLLTAVINELAGDAKISFEGDLHAFALSSLPDASPVETAGLKRSTLSPKQDFVVVPLNNSTVKAISRSIGGTLSRAILHVQIEKRGRLEFAAFDNFQHIFFGEAPTAEFVESLVAEGILKQTSE